MNTGITYERNSLATARRKENMNCDKCGSSHPVMDTRYCEEVSARKANPTPTSATVDEIARKLEIELRTINEAMSLASEGSRRHARREAIQAAIAPLRAENTMFRQKLQAELEQAKEESSYCKKHYDLAFQEVKDLQSRLAAMEATLKEILDSARPNPTQHPAMHEAWEKGRAYFAARAKEKP